MVGFLLKYLLGSKAISAASDVLGGGDDDTDIDAATLKEWQRHLKEHKPDRARYTPSSSASHLIRTAQGDGRSSIRGEKSRSASRPGKKLTQVRFNVEREKKEIRDILRADPLPMVQIGSTAADQIRSESLKLVDVSSVSPQIQSNFQIVGRQINIISDALTKYDQRFTQFDKSVTEKIRKTSELTITKQAKLTQLVDHKVDSLEDSFRVFDDKLAFHDTQIDKLVHEIGKLKLADKTQSQKKDIPGLGRRKTKSLDVGKATKLGLLGVLGGAGILGYVFKDEIAEWWDKTGKQLVWDLSKKAAVAAAGGAWDWLNSGVPKLQQQMNDLMTGNAESMTEWDKESVRVRQQMNALVEWAVGQGYRNLQQGYRNLQKVPAYKQRQYDNKRVPSHKELMDRMIYAGPRGSSKGQEPKQQYGPPRMSRESYGPPRSQGGSSYLDRNTGSGSGGIKGSSGRSGVQYAPLRPGSPYTAPMHLGGPLPRPQRGSPRPERETQRVYSREKLPSPFYVPPPYDRHGRETRWPIGEFGGDVPPGYRRGTGSGSWGNRNRPPPYSRSGGGRDGSGSGYDYSGSGSSNRDYDYSADDVGDIEWINEDGTSAEPDLKSSGESGVKGDQKFAPPMKLGGPKAPAIIQQEGKYQGGPPVDKGGKAAPGGQGIRAPRVSKSLKSNEKKARKRKAKPIRVIKRHGVMSKLRGSKWGSRAKPKPYKYIGIHYTSGGSLSGAMEWGAKKNTGYQYLIDKDGTVHMVQDPEKGRTNHWGTANKHPEARNSNSVSISFVGKEGRATKEQIRAGLGLIEHVRKRYNIDRKNVLGHGEVTQGHRSNEEGYDFLLPYRRMYGVKDPNIAQASGSYKAWRKRYRNTISTEPRPEGDSKAPEIIQQEGKYQGGPPVDKGGRAAPGSKPRSVTKERITNSHLAKIRKELFDEMDAKPYLKGQIQDLIVKENRRHPEGPLEALMNRIAMRRMQGKKNWGVEDELKSGFFGPYNRGNVKSRLNDRAAKAFVKVKGGSNDIKLRTDQGMKHEHHGQPGMLNIGGEWYSHMDRGKWAKVTGSRAAVAAKDERKSQEDASLPENWPTSKRDALSAISMGGEQQWVAPPSLIKGPEQPGDIHDSSRPTPLGFLDAERIEGAKAVDLSGTQGDATGFNPVKATGVPGVNLGNLKSPSLPTTQPSLSTSQPKTPTSTDRFGGFKGQALSDAGPGKALSGTRPGKTLSDVGPVTTSPITPASIKPATPKAAPVTPKSPPLPAAKPSPAQMVKPHKPPQYYVPTKEKEPAPDPTVAAKEEDTERKEKGGDAAITQTQPRKKQIKDPDVAPTPTQPDGNDGGREVVDPRGAGNVADTSQAGPGDDGGGAERPCLI